MLYQLNEKGLWYIDRNDNKGAVILKPGIHRLSNDEWDDIVKNKADVQDALSDGRLSIFSKDDRAIDSAFNIGEKRPDEVENVVDGIFDRTTLKNLIVKENSRLGGGRKSVLDLLNHQIRLVEEIE